jgi:hypothetical protein
MDEVESALRGFRRFMLVVCFGAAIIAVATGYHAAKDEMTGVATYYKSTGKGSRGETVTREGAPAKFRDAINTLGTTSMIGLVVSVASFAVYWKLDERTPNCP